MTGRAKSSSCSRIRTPSPSKPRLASEGRNVTDEPGWLRLSLCRSWSSPTSSPCSTASTLSSPPKSLVWTRCSWRAKARPPTPATPPCPPSRVTHRRLSSNTPLDRRLFPGLGRDGRETAAGNSRADAVGFKHFCGECLDLKTKPLFWGKTQENSESNCILISWYEINSSRRESPVFPPTEVCFSTAYSALVWSATQPNYKDTAHTQDGNDAECVSIIVVFLCFVFESLRFLPLTYWFIIRTKLKIYPATQLLDESNTNIKFLQVWCIINQLYPINLLLFLYISIFFPLPKYQYLLDPLYM